MLRYLLVLLAILIGVLAYLFDRPWLWVGAGLIFVGGVGLLAWRALSGFREKDERTRGSGAVSEESNASLDDLGIVDIRPQERNVVESTPSPSSQQEGETEPSGDSMDSLAGASASGEHPATKVPSEKNGTEMDEAGEGPVATEGEPVLAPLMQSLRAALEAETVCLLVQEQVALTYRIEVLASAHSTVRTAGTFDTQTPLLTASMSRHAISVRALAETELAVEDLGYYEAPPKIDHLAVAPVPRPDEPSTTFLLADATKGTDLDSSQARSVLEHFAEVVDVLLPPNGHGLDRVGEQERTEQTESEAGSADEVDTEPEEGAETAPRPRREIIAEEIDAAEAASEEMSLVLVHLNRAESIARRGDEAVASAERLLRARLDQMAPNQRIERFGELTYGLFFRGGADVLEPWVADLESAMAREEGELEGGVSVGVAVRSNHDAKTLRADATEALHEAYKTGTSTIVA